MVRKKIAMLFYFAGMEATSWGYSFFVAKTLTLVLSWMDENIEFEEMLERAKTAQIRSVRK